MMLTCGHYDGSGDFAFRVGIPGKKRRWRRILGIVPGMASLAVMVARSQRNGNSIAGFDRTGKTGEDDELVDFRADADKPAH